MMEEGITRSSEHEEEKERTRKKEWKSTGIQ
jgi:hypothetical protein